MKKLTIEDIVAVFNRPITLNEHGCWLWLGNTDENGYARYAGRLMHRIAWFRAGFECDDGLEICHTCPNHNCINPDHLYAGTHVQNMNDVNRRMMGPKGRLSEEQIVELNLMLLKGIPKTLIAKHLGVSKPWITKFLNGGFIYAKPCEPSE
jgi:hypothetical protein